MSDSATGSQPIQPIPDGSFTGELLDMPPAVGWVVHEAIGKPQATDNQVIWAWCTVSTEGPGYSSIEFTEADGSTPAEPYPLATPESKPRPVRLGPVLFKVFC